MDCRSEWDGWVEVVFSLDKIAEGIVDIWVFFFLKLFMYLSMKLCAHPNVETQRVVFSG